MKEALVKTVRVLVLEDEDSFHANIELRFAEVFDVAPELIACRSVEEAAAAYCHESSLEFDLLVVDLKVPLKNGSEAIDRGGLTFIEQHVLESTTQPPVILTSGIEDPDARNADRLSRVVFLDKAYFTFVSLTAICRTWAIGGVKKSLSRLFDPKDIDNGTSYVTHVDVGLKSAFDAHIESVRENSQKLNGITVLLGMIDDSLLQDRDAVLGDSEAISKIVFWCRRIEKEITRIDEDRTEPGAQLRNSQNRLRLAWLQMLRMELWSKEKPIDALRGLIASIGLNAEAHKPPIGLPDEPTYKIGARVIAQSKWTHLLWQRWKTISPGAARWTTEVVRRLVERSASAPNNAGKMDRADCSDKPWRQLLRHHVSNATREARRQPPPVLHSIELRLRELRTKLITAGDNGAVNEVEARLCGVRRWRLNAFERTLYGILEFTCDYGNQPSRLFACSVALIGFFALLYYPMPSWLDQWLPEAFRIQLHPCPFVVASPGAGFGGGVVTLLTNLVTAMYFSVVTFVTLGYGDIVPANDLGRIVCSLEALLGFTVFGLFIAVMSTKLRPL